MFAFDNSLAEYLTPSLGNEDENDISPAKTPDYRCSDEKCNQEIDVFKDKKDNQNPSKPTETFQFMHFASCHPPGVKYGFIKGRNAIRLLRTYSSEKNSRRGPFETQTTPQSNEVPRKQRKVAVRGQLCL